MVGRSVLGSPYSSPSVEIERVEQPAAQWTTAERESFFDAIARHRRASWRVTAASSFANLIVAVIVAAMMAPLFYAVICLGLDLLNLVHHTPNLVSAIGDIVGPLVDKPESVPLTRWIFVGVLAAAPGLAWMTILLIALRRMLQVSAMFDSGELRARAPDPTVLAEQRMSNVVGEMAIAANLPTPRLLITDLGCNAAVFGRDEQHATIVVSESLIARLDRAEMQGVTAHLVGSIANGDMAIGLQATSTLSLFALISRVGTVVTDRAAWRPLLRILLGLLWPTKARSRRLAAELGDPFGPHTAAESSATDRAPSAASSTSTATKDDWRSMLWLPLAGSVVMAAFFAGLVSLFLLGPLLSLAWRQRKYMADATAVKLTRDPNTLAEALEKMQSAGGHSVFAPWAAHLSVVSRAGGRGLMGNSAVPMCPSLDRRLLALGKMGAHLTHAPKKMPRIVILVLVPVAAIIGMLVSVALFLLAWLSLPLTALFMGIPFAIIHLLLRWIGG